MPSDSRVTPSQLDGVSIQPDNLDFPDAPSINNSQDNQLHGDDKAHPAAKQALILGALGLLLIALLTFGATQLTKEASPLSSNGSALYSIEAKLSEIVGDVNVSHDNGETWGEARADETVSTGTHIQTGSGGLAVIHFENGDRTYLNQASTMRIRSLNSLQVAVDHYAGELYGVSTNPSTALKINAGDQTFTTRESTFVTRVNDQQSSIEVYSGSISASSSSSQQISEGFRFDGQSVAAFPVASPETPAFISWVLQQR